MSAFLTELQMENATGKDDGHWRLIAPLVYQSDVAGMIFTVPTGFITDLASVPRVPIAYLLARHVERGERSSRLSVLDAPCAAQYCRRSAARGVGRNRRACLAPVADVGGADRRADRTGTAQRRPDLCGAGWLRAGQCPLAHINHLAPVAIPVTRSQCRWDE